MMISILPLLFVCFSFTMLLLSPSQASHNDRMAYVVYLGDCAADTETSFSSIHTTFLEVVLGSNSSASLIQSYGRSFNGFVVEMTKEDMLKVKAQECVVSVFANGKKQLHTTRSWDFIGFPQSVNRTSIESDIIVGVLDSGIWPESDSFSDAAFGPPPTKWRGSCQTSSNFICNNKIIGAKFYRSDGKFSEKDFASPRDAQGHGTHTASTAAGGVVSMASLMGLASGTARGAVPSARIAVYKVCWSDGCSDADILAAFDDAIADGVDILSASFGSSDQHDYFSDSTSIGSFHAMKNGILTSASAGNSGPGAASVANYSPWQLSVAASTTDRKLSTDVVLGNNLIYEGVSVNAFESTIAYPVVYGGDAPNLMGGFNFYQSRNCIEGSLDPSLVGGKIVLCDVKNRGIGALAAGAVGMVMQDGGVKDHGSSLPLPSTYLGVQDGLSLLSYIRTTRNPIAKILKSTEQTNLRAPFVAAFSSRGPNPVTRDILKPDISAPGVEILAAWSGAASVSEVEDDNRRVLYNILSGTSMSCPHTTGAAVYVKSFHPFWSPAALKSALMTTATPMSITTSPDAEFAYGAGQINPQKAVDPGLVYDADQTDYTNFLCGQDYSAESLQRITGDNSACTDANMIIVWDLNLPSFAFSTLPSQSFSRTFTRTVTNVGSPISSYTATINGGTSTLNIKVEPTVLSFTSIGQKLSFVVTAEGMILATRTKISASLVWDDGVHQVRSPIMLFSSI